MDPPTSSFVANDVASSISQNQLPGSENGGRNRHPDWLPEDMQYLKGSFAGPTSSSLHPGAVHVLSRPQRHPEHPVRRQRCDPPVIENPDSFCNMETATIENATTTPAAATDATTDQSATQGQSEDDDNTNINGDEAVTTNVDGAFMATAELVEPGPEPVNAVVMEETVWDKCIPDTRTKVGRRLCFAIVIVLVLVAVTATATMCGSGYCNSNVDQPPMIRTASGRSDFFANSSPTASPSKNDPATTMPASHTFNVSVRYALGSGNSRHLLQGPEHLRGRHLQLNKLLPLKHLNISSNVGSWFVWEKHNATSDEDTSTTVNVTGSYSNATSILFIAEVDYFNELLQMAFPTSYLNMTIVAYTHEEFTSFEISTLAGHVFFDPLPPLGSIYEKFLFDAEYFRDDVVRPIGGRFANLTQVSLALTGAS
ncbi:expressed unknown protein [Seminavis robusta]|uniref:Uncharacterized protein n=1 Tax=Seminavis robusta TaxID=568900 RepID=A0A9N8DH17_9STRA|nr:expressed unknown protein [Seminavis robusta]|eukprot:Sro141_g065890.1 n/a (426) ;mRNA; r:74122-75399